MATLVASPTVNVRLSQEGVAFAGKHPLTVHAGTVFHTFKPGVADPFSQQEAQILLKTTDAKGIALFEIAPDPLAAAATAPSAPAPAAAQAAPAAAATTTAAK